MKVSLPVTATQQEIRCDTLICRNALDIPETEPLSKYSIYLDRVAEPQDAVGARVGTRQRLPTLSLNMASLFTESITIDTVTLTGAQVMAFVNALIDAHKSENLS